MNTLLKRIRVLGRFPTKEDEAEVERPPVLHEAGAEVADQQVVQPAHPHGWPDLVRRG